MHAIDIQKTDSANATKDEAPWAQSSKSAEKGEGRPIIANRRGAPPECKCIPDGHEIASTDAALIRRVRKDTLHRVKQYEAQLATETDPKERRWLEQVIVCCNWSAYQSLVRLRELRAPAA